VGAGRGLDPGDLLHIHVSPFAVRANSSTGSVGRGHVWLPLVHAHVVNGSPELWELPTPFVARGLVVTPLVLWKLTPLVKWWFMCRV
jgi:hypothetical protein